MKNKILPLSLVTLVIFLGAFFISATLPLQEPDEGGPDKQDQKAQKSHYSNYLTKIRANQNTHILDQADVIKANEEAAVLKNGSGTAEDFDWYFLGPDNAGGFTGGVIYDNTDETYRTIIAGAFTGGLYKSVNNGLTWNKINGIQNNLKVSCITQTNDGMIYVGTGGLLNGSGIYTSSNGQDFSLLSSTNPANNESFSQIRRIAVAGNGNIFVSTHMGLWYSTDGGTTWMPTESDGTQLTGNSTDVNVGSNGLVAASMDGLCYISADGNPANFMLHSSDTFNLPFQNVGNLELAIAPSDPNILYATVLDVNDELINVYRSDNAGINWRIIGPGESTNFNVTFTADNNVLTVFPQNPDRVLVGGNNMWEGQKLSETGFFQWVRKSDGQIPSAIEPSYVHTWHYSYSFRPGTTNELLVGHNGGISRGTITSVNYEFVEINKTYTTSTALNTGFGGYEKIIFGTFEQNGIQFIDGTANPDINKEGSQILGPIPPYGGNGSEAFVSVIDPAVVIFSSEGGDFQRSEDLGANNSTTFLSSDMNFPEEYHAPAIYWERFDNENSRDTVGYKVNDTIPAGTTIWIPSHNRAFPFKHTAPTTYYPGDSIRIQDPVSTKTFIGSDEEVWMTTMILDFTQEPEWFLISDIDAGLEGIVSSMGLSEDANFLFVGTEEGRLYRIANIALAYNYERADVRSDFCIISTAEIPVIDPSTQAQNTQIITSVSVDPQNPNSVIITMGNYGNNHYVYRSSNALSANPTFTSIQGALPKMPIYSSLIEMNNSSKCILGTENGLYVSDNVTAGTPTWAESFDVTGRVPVMDIKQQLIAQETITLWFWDGVDTTYVVYPGTRNYGCIYLATYGRGIYYSTKYQKPVGIISNDMPEQMSGVKVYPNPVSHLTNLEYTLDSPSEVIIKVIDINGKLMLSESISQSMGTHQYKLDCSAYPRGMYIVSVQAGKSIETTKFIVSQ